MILVRVLQGQLRSTQSCLQERDCCPNSGVTAHRNFNFDSGGELVVPLESTSKTQCHIFSQNNLSSDLLALLARDSA